MMVWKMIFLFNWVVFTFHVNLPGCSSPDLSVPFMIRGTNLQVDSLIYLLDPNLLFWSELVDGGRSQRNEILLPRSSKRCQMVPKGCQVTIP